jgi:hypothetical protein
MGIVVLLILISPIFLYSIYFVNLDWLVIAALLVSPVPAFFLALLKPQIGLGIALLAWLRVWQTNKPLAVLLIAIEVMIYGASYALGMRWEFALANFNRSVFPFGVIIGLPLIVIGLRQRDAVIALAAMPFLSPYVGAQSWVAALPLLARFAPNARAPGSRPTSRFVKRFSVVDPSELASHVHSPTQEIDDAIREYAQFTMNHGWIRRLSDKLLAGHRLTSVDRQPASVRQHKAEPSLSC